MSGIATNGPSGERRALERAAEWLSLHLDDCPRPIIPYIKQAYGLGNVDAIEAIRLARLSRETGA